jgi:heme/copper-type cytochrome/quinol oxidase subunit 2
MYCSCLMVSGVVFFIIIAIMESNGNPFLNRNHPEESGDRVRALIIAICINIVCFIGCVTCVVTGNRKEALEKLRKDEEQLKKLDDGIDLDG